MDDFNVYTTKNAEETQRLGSRFASHIIQYRQKHKNNHAYVIALSGELGSGKTTFIQGIARGLGITGRILSPSFVLLRIHRSDVSLYHIDLYRIKSREEVNFNIEEYIADSASVICIEWPEIVKKLLPSDTIYIKMNTLESGIHTLTSSVHI